MKTTSEYTYDVFVSYAHVDDEAFPGIDKGWVSYFIQSLKILIAQRMGRQEAIGLWVDNRLPQFGELDSRIRETIESSATLLVILSPGYLQSEWCRWEREHFLRTRPQGSKPIVFVLELDPLDRSEYPSEFRPLLNFTFWEPRSGQRFRRLGSPRPDPSRDFEYFLRIQDVAEAVSAEVKRLRDQTSVAPVGPIIDDPEVERGEEPTVPPHDSKSVTTVYLAETTDDLEQQRLEVKRYFEQFDIEIVPDCWHSRQTNEFRDQVRHDLRRSQAFVQLLSGVTGKLAPMSDSTYAMLQYQEALQIGIPLLLQWRDRRAEVDDVANAAHRQLLEGPDVMASPLQEFKREALDRILLAQEGKEVTTPSPVAPHSSLVFVNSDREDRDVAKQICRALETLGYAYALPVENGDPAAVRQDLEENLVDCDGLVIVYGKITKNWVREQLRQWRKIAGRRSKPLGALIVYEGPPPGEKDSIDMMFPAMKFIDGKSSSPIQSLQPLLNSLKAE